MSHFSKNQLAEEARKTLAELKKPLSPKQRLAIPAQEMPAQDPAVRRCNMQEVALGYTEEQAILEAERCLQCPTKPCVKGCPVGIDIPAFIGKIAEGDCKAAIGIIRESSLLPAVCGRVCPQESQCQEPCTVGKALKSIDKAVSIGRLERYVADWERENGLMQPPVVKTATGKKVGIIGSGPASITVAADVRREGHEVTVFEAFHRPGGVLLYGIPEFRLPKAIVDQEINSLKTMGVEIKTDFVIGRTRRLTDLLEKDGYDALFIGTGAGLPKFMNIEGENLVGVFSANEYLTRANLMKGYDDRAATPIFPSKKVAVLGGGNVAMDAARSAIRLGAEEVHLIYRRTEAEMPARVEEVAHAKEEGVIFHMLRNPKSILADERGWVCGMEVLKYELGEPDSSGRRRPIEVKGSEFQMDVDTVIVAIGNESNPLIRQTTPGLETSKWGTLIVDDTGKTSLDRVFAGGDIVLGAATVILAMGEGRRAAAAINKLLAEK
ncbi:MAG: NADPH-dependent glutamate synthase [Verrucomicrobia bacterium]|nr:NADPH-dependent glutamate synthase [Verrucomicrobiota bacterium]